MPSTADGLPDPVDTVLDRRLRPARQQRGRGPVAVQRRARRVHDHAARVTLTSTTAASSAAQIAPCAASTRPPITPANPCTAPSFAFARDIPPSRLHSAMSVRAADVGAVRVGRPQAGRGPAQALRGQRVGQRSGLRD